MTPMPPSRPYRRQRDPKFGQSAAYRSSQREKVASKMSHSANCITSEEDADRALVRSFIYKVKIACDDLHGDPFDQDARRALLSLLAEESQAADAAHARVRRRSAVTIDGRRY